MHRLNGNISDWDLIEQPEMEGYSTMQHHSIKISVNGL